MIVLQSCTTPAETRDAIADFLTREASRYRRDADRERSPSRKAQDVARSRAMKLAAEMVAEARIEP